MHAGRRTRPGGFTLVELLVTLAILAVLASLAVPVAQIGIQRSQEQELRRALRDIRAGIDAYKRASDDGRVQKSVDASGYPTSLALLVEGVRDQRDPDGGKIYFLRRVPRNPFHPDSGLDADATWSKRSYASDAAAPQEGADVYDVYVDTPLVGLNGLPYRQW